MLATTRSSDVVLALGRDGHGIEQFATVSMLSVEEAMTWSTAALVQPTHYVDRAELNDAGHTAAVRGLVLEREQRNELENVSN